MIHTNPARQCTRLPSCPAGSTCCRSQCRRLPSQRSREHQHTPKSPAAAPRLNDAAIVSPVLTSADITSTVRHYVPKLYELAIQAAVGRVSVLQGLHLLPHSLLEELVDRIHGHELFDMLLATAGTKPIHSLRDFWQLLNLRFAEQRRLLQLEDEVLCDFTEADFFPLDVPESALLTDDHFTLLEHMLEQLPQLPAHAPLWLIRCISCNGSLDLLLGTADCVGSDRIGLFRGCGVLTSQTVMRILSGHTQVLTDLDLSGAQGPDDSCLEALGQLPQLHRLQLAGVRTFTDSGVQLLGASQEVLGNPLCELNLHSCKQLTNLSLQHIGRYCGGLKNLCLHGCPAMNNDGIASLLTGGPLDLRRFNNAGCYKQTVVARQMMLGTCPFVAFYYRFGEF